MTKTSNVEKTIGEGNPTIYGMDNKYPYGSEKWLDANFGDKIKTPAPDKNKLAAFKKVSAGAKAFAQDLVEQSKQYPNLLGAVKRLHEVVTEAKIAIQLGTRQQGSF